MRVAVNGWDENEKGEDLKAIMDSAYCENGIDMRKNRSNYVKRYVCKVEMGGSGGSIFQEWERKEETKKIKKVKDKKIFS